MSIKISASNNVEFLLGEKDREKSIIQNVSLIIGTWQGSVPLFREFGISSEPLHRPINIAKVMLCPTIKEAVEMYEPRVSVIGVTFEGDENSPDKLIPTVEVEILNEQ